jgi:hypothetical protein
MLLMRRFEEKAGQIYGMGLIGGFCHLYIGQEAVVLGVQSVLKPVDTVITAYRDHAHIFQGQGRLNAYVQPREELLWWAWHCWRAGADRRWPRFCPQIQE